MTRPLVAWALVALVWAPQTGLAGDGERMISQTESLTLTEKDYQQYIEHILPEKARRRALDDEYELKDLVVTLHSQTAMAEEAQRTGLGEQPGVEARLQRARRKILVDALLDRKRAGIQYPDLSKLARERYEAHPETYRRPERRKAAHILLEPMPRRAKDCEVVDAKALVGRLDEGADFAKLARRYSDDSVTASKGGVIDRWAREGKQVFVEPFQQALFQLEAEGEVSAPVHTRFGVHIIRLAELKEGEIPPFEKVKDQIVADLRREYRQSRLKEFAQKHYPDLGEADLDAVRRLLKASLERDRAADQE